MLKKIPVTRLRPGMFIQELCGDWMSHPFWRAQFVLKGDGDLRRIVEAGIQHVYIDTKRGLDDVEAVAADQVQAAVEQEIVAALQSYQGTLGKMLMLIECYDAEDADGCDAILTAFHGTGLDRNMLNHCLTESLHWINGKEQND